VKKTQSHHFHNSFASKVGSLDLQILATVAYSSQFKFPLLESEILQRLIRPEVVEQQLIKTLMIKQQAGGIFDNIDFQNRSSPSLELLRSRFNKLVETGVLQKWDDYFCFVDKFKDGRGHESQRLVAQNWVKSRRQNNINSYLVRDSAYGLIRAALKIGWIEAIGITGSVAARSAKPNDDLDLLIVTKPGTLWITRLVLLLLAIVNGKKRVSFFGKVIFSDQWCFNLWMDLDSLSLPQEKRSIFDALESMQIDWIYDAGNVQKKFTQSNSWLGNFLVNQKYQVTQELASDSNKAEQNERLSGFLNWINHLIFKLSASHLHQKNNIPFKNLNINRAFMHDGVSHLKYLEEWQTLFQQATQKLQEIK